jgi:hypothetical protein
MGNWMRSLIVLGVAFAGALVVTIGLANVIVPGQADAPPAADGGSGDGATPAPSLAPITGVGGHLTVTGDLDGTLTVTSESNDGRYTLEGSDARIVFEGSPPVVVQVSWEGLEFFPEPEDCTITPGELNDQTGIGYAEVACEGLTDLRGGGTVDVAGTIGLALNMVGESDLPEMGGSVSVGEETWEFEEAFLFLFPVNFGPGTQDYNMILTDAELGVIRFRYDVQTHRLALIEVGRGPTPDARPFEGEVAAVPAGACNLGTNELGRQSPDTAVVELSISCPATEVPELGTVPITGTLIVQQLESVP